MMQIVIEIPEESYRLLQNKGVDWLGAEHILTAVANGTPLPKGHGDLIDKDMVLRNAKSTQTIVDVNNVPTIIPAERSDAE
jgi:hypothetical protein